MTIAAYIVLFFAVMFLGLMLVLRKRVQLAIAVIKEAARSLAAIPALIFMPVLQSLGLVIFLVPWVVYCVYLASSGELKTVEMPPLISNGDTTTVRTFEYNSNTRYAFLYMLFSYFECMFNGMVGIVNKSIGAWPSAPAGFFSRKSCPFS